jgi:hypothetical protein
VGSIEGRLRRLEQLGRVGGCPEGGLHPDGRVAVTNEEHPEKNFAGDPDEMCRRCGWPLYTVVRVVYDGEEGGGA